MIVFCLFVMDVDLAAFIDLADLMDFIHLMDFTSFAWWSGHLIINPAISKAVLLAMETPITAEEKETDYQREQQIQQKCPMQQKSPVLNMQKTLTF